MALPPEQMEAFQQMAVQVNDGLSQVGQILGKIDQAAGQEMGNLQKGYQQIITAALNGGGQASDSQRPPEAGAADVRPAQ